MHVDDGCFRDIELVEDEDWDERDAEHEEEDNGDGLMESEPISRWMRHKRTHVPRECVVPKRQYREQ